MADKGDPCFSRGRKVYYYGMRQEGTHIGEPRRSPGGRELVTMLVSRRCWREGGSPSAGCDGIQGLHAQNPTAVGRDEERRCGRAAGGSLRRRAGPALAGWGCKGLRGYVINCDVLDGINIIKHSISFQMERGIRRAGRSSGPYTRQAQRIRKRVGVDRSEAHCSGLVSCPQTRLGGIGFKKAGSKKDGHRRIERPVEGNRALPHDRGSGPGAFREEGYVGMVWVRREETPARTGRSELGSEHSDEASSEYSEKALDDAKKEKARTVPCRGMELAIDEEGWLAIKVEKAVDTAVREGLEMDWLMADVSEWCQGKERTEMADKQEGVLRLLKNLMHIGMEKADNGYERPGGMMEEEARERELEAVAAELMLERAMRSVWRILFMSSRGICCYRFKIQGINRVDKVGGPVTPGRREIRGRYGQPRGTGRAYEGGKILGSLGGWGVKTENLDRIATKRNCRQRRGDRAPASITSGLQILRLRHQAAGGVEIGNGGATVSGSADTALSVREDLKITKRGSVGAWRSCPMSLCKLRRKGGTLEF